MKLSSPNARQALIGVAIVLAVALIWLTTSRLSRVNSVAFQTTDAANNLPKQRDLVMSNDGVSSSVTSVASAVLATSNTSSNLAVVANMAREQDLSKLLNDVRRTDNLFTQEYAVFAPSELCLTIRVVPQAGLLALIDSKAALLPIVEKQLLPTTLEPRKQIQARCAPYSRDGHLRDALAKELIGRGPVSRIQGLPWADDDGNVSDTNIQVAKLALETVLTDINAPTLLQLTKTSVARWSQQWIVTSLPPEYRADAFLLSVIAIEIAACRGGAPCDGGSIARDALCAKYGECTELDVESSYRRLHSLYQVPFTMTENLVTRYQQALAAKNAGFIFAK